MEAQLIAGSPNYGVAIAPEYAATYANIKAMAKSSYAAFIVKRELEALLGNGFKDSVYTTTEVGNGGYATYKMVLPGCVAYFHKNAQGCFYIYHLEANFEYLDLQRKGAKPGLHRVENKDRQWMTEFAENGQIKTSPGRVVAISDSGSSLEEAVGAVVPVITSAPEIGESKKALKLDGFDLHFTPGKTRFGGMRNRIQAAQPETTSSLNESALLLANTMQYAVKTKMVSWITQGGGSGIMTQALQILKDKNIDFSGTEHQIFFSGITTNLVKAEQLARDLGLETGRLTHSRNPLNLNQLLGPGLLNGYAAAWQRYRQEKAHTTLKFSADIVRETSQLTSVPALFGLSASAALGVPAAALAMPAGVMFMIAAGPKILSGGNKLFEAWFPEQYRKLSGKF